MRSLYDLQSTISARVLIIYELGIELNLQAMVEYQHIAIGLLTILCVLLGSNARRSCRNAKLILALLIARALRLGQANGRPIAIYCDWQSAA